MTGSMTADRKYSPGAGADSLDLSHKQETERANWERGGLLKPSSPPAVTQLQGNHALNSSVMVFKAGASVK